jgi:hypothetical protein
LTAPDQLRHRVSWALSSIFIVTERDIDLAEGNSVESDPFISYNLHK